MFDLDRCNLKHDFLSGNLIARQIVSDSEDNLPALGDINEAVSKGDTVTLEIMGEETIEITDREVCSFAFFKILIFLIYLYDFFSIICV